MQVIPYYMERHDFLSDRDLYHMKKRQEINFQLPWSTEGAIFEKKEKKYEKMRIFCHDMNFEKTLKNNIF